MAYLKNKYFANIKKWKLDLSEYKDGVYEDNIEAPKDIKEFNGFEELFGFEIKEVKGSLSFSRCTSLTSVSNLPENIEYWISFFECTSLKSVSNLPDKIGGWLSFFGCTSLKFISKMPSIVEEDIYTQECQFFKCMGEAKIREKYGILKE